MIKDKVQTLGKFLSGMVIPNIGAFIAWGFITAIFIPSGWYPNEKIAMLVEPLIKYLLPLLVGVTGGKVAGGIRGGVVASIATMGVIVGSDIPMLIGAMIIGPLSGYIIKKFDKLINNKIPAGFEMLINNFSIAIIGVILAVTGLFIVGPSIEIIAHIINRCVTFIINKGFLPLLAIFIEPAKVMFLNNAINHGIINFISIEQVNDSGKSILYLLEANPGPGLGVILSYWIYSKGVMKESAPSAVIIQFLGGLHEIYFPYISVNPSLILASIMGSMASIIVFLIVGSGLIATASPGSIFSIIMLSPKSDIIGNILGVLIGAIVSFIISSLIFKRKILKSEEKEIKSENEENIDINCNNIGKIVFACDVGMGSSAMGATKFRGKIKKLNLDIDVVNSAVNNIPSDADIVITHRGLIGSIKNISNKYQIVFIENFLDDERLEQLYDELYEISNMKYIYKEKEKVKEEKKSSILDKSNIVLGISSESKEEAIIRAGELLVEKGYTNSEYIDSMLERENRISTYIGMGIAIPHGTEEGKSEVEEAGIIILQYPEGVKFGNQVAYLIIAIAAKVDEHLDILSKIAASLDNIELIESLKTTSDSGEILKVFNI